MPPSRDDLIIRARGCHGLLSMITERIDGLLLDAIGPQLCGIANYGVGYNNIDLQASKSRGIAVGNTPNALTNATADVAVGLMLAAGRHFQQGVDAVRNRQWKTWEPLGYIGQEFEGRTLGIIGLGRIGYAMAKRCYGGWGMKVLYTSRSPKTEWAQQLQATRVDFEELMRRSDVVSLHCDLNPETELLINRQTLGWMRPSAILVNTARGGMVDQPALYDALRSGGIFAAGLDVTDPEPIAEDSPLRLIPNCIILPHIGSATSDARNTMARIAAMNLLAALEGQPMPCAVRPD